MKIPLWSIHKKAENQQGAHEDNYRGKKQSLKKAGNLTQNYNMMQQRTKAKKGFNTQKHKGLKGNGTQLWSLTHLN